MKKCNTIVLLSTAAFLLFSGLHQASAQQLFRAVLSTTCVSTNDTGGLSSERMGNQDLISQCAQDLGITNLSGLTLVYNLTSNALQVVGGTNLTSIGTNHTIIGTNLFLLCTPLRFTNTVSLTDTNTNRVELLASVFVETNATPTGSLVATERFQYGTSNQLSSFSLIGRIAYAVPAVGTNGTSICRGVLVVGAATGEDEENEEGEGGPHGNNGLHLGQILGNHGNGNNGNGNGNNGNHGNHH